MKFEMVRPGEYRAKLEDSMFIWVCRQGKGRWVWFLGGTDNGNVWESDEYGPFPTKKSAIASAIADYEDILID